MDTFPYFACKMKTISAVGIAGLLLLSLIFTPSSGFAQKLGLEPDKWAIELAKGGLTEENSMGSLNLLLEKADSARAFGFLDSCETAGKEKGYFFTAHFNMVKAKYLYDKFAGIDKFKDSRAKQLEPLKAQIMQLHLGAIEASYHTEDDRTIGWASFYSAAIMRQLGEISLAVMYSKNGVDLFERAKYDVEPTVYTWLSELLYEIKEYDESYINAQKAIVAWAKIKDPEYNEKRLQLYHVRAQNSMALNYFTRKNIDSAITHFERALQIAHQIKDTVWEAKVLGNIGRVLYHQKKFDSAYTLFKKDYYESKAAGMYDNAASAAEWAAKANLAKGNTAAALAEARSAKELLTMWPNRSYLRDTYYTLALIFKSSKNFDSAFFYNDLYIALNDSLEKEIATSSLKISKAKINDEISQFNIQKLKRQKEREIFWRNIIIVAIIVVALIALLIVNRQLLAEKLHKQNAERDKTLLEQEVKAAINQLHLFTENIIEKNKLIASLETQMNNRQLTDEHHATLHTLGQLTILTEDDWNKFKTLYEKAYPGFFRKISEQYSDMTLAEQRMAALCKLRLSNTEMAAMLGISTDSVRKSKQRLRSRIGLPGEASLEDYFVGW